MWGDQSWRSERTWSLGSMSRPFAVISVIWIIAITPLFLYPFGLNPAALATVAGFVIFLAIYYVLWARTRFTGPRRQGSDAELTEIEKRVRAGGRGAREPGSRLTRVDPPRQREGRPASSAGLRPIRPTPARTR